MSIEASPLLDPFIKAKLQEQGIITTVQLEDSLKSCGALSPYVLKVSDPTQHEDSADSTEQCLSALLKLFPCLTRDEGLSLLQSYHPTLVSALSHATRAKKKRKVEGGHDNDSCKDFVALHVHIETLEELLKRRRQERRERGGCTHLTTFCRSVDDMLGGGIPVCSVTEFSGPPGVGKTQLMMQLAVSSVLPQLMGGLEGSCILVDTEGSVVLERLHQIVTAAVARIRQISGIPTVAKAGEKSHAGSTHPPLSRAAELCTVENLLKHIHYCRVGDVATLMGVLHTLPDMLEDIHRLPSAFSCNKTQTVKMVLVDSIAMPFRSLDAFDTVPANEDGGVDDRSGGSFSLHRKRSRLVFMAGQLLHQLSAPPFNLTVVVSNHVVSRPLQLRAENASILLPAMGEYWGHGLSTRVILSHHHYHLPFDTSPMTECGCTCEEHGGESVNGASQHRVARLVKGAVPSDSKEVCFSITHKGIRDWVRSSGLKKRSEGLTD